jgi:D-inositol-3-phosphate glycosyltransferase
MAMRLLFLHAALDGMTPEYRVHTTLAKNAMGEGLDPYFIWQSSRRANTVGSLPFDTERTVQHDFGRDMSIVPEPGRYRRARMVARNLPRSLAFVMSKAKGIRPDAIYTSQQYFDVLLARLVSRSFRIPHVIHLHYGVGPWLGASTLKIIQRSSRLIAVSEFVRQTALLQGVAPASIHTVVNALSLTEYEQDVDPRATRAQFQIEADAPLIVAVGRIDPGKGHAALFEAFAHVRRRLPRARLLVCGAPTSRDSYGAWLRQRVSELQIEAAVIFAGFRRDVPAIMRSADVFCLPAELEPFGLVYLEAMAAGLPVVACHSGGVPEIVLHNQTGLLSYPDEIEALASNLLRVLSDSGLARRLGQAAKRRVATAFEPECVARRWLRVLHKKVP